MPYFGLDAEADALVFVEVEGGGIVGPDPGCFGDVAVEGFREWRGCGRWGSEGAEGYLRVLEGKTYKWQFSKRFAGPGTVMSSKNSSWTGGGLGGVRI